MVQSSVDAAYQPEDRMMLSAVEVCGVMDVVTKVTVNGAQVDEFTYDKEVCSLLYTKTHCMIVITIIVSFWHNLMLCIYISKRCACFSALYMSYYM